MEKGWNLDGGRFESGLRCTDLLLGLASLSDEGFCIAEDESLKELMEEEVFWADNETKENSSESHDFSHGRSTTKMSQRTSESIRMPQRERTGSLSHFYNQSAPVNVPQWPGIQRSQPFLDNNDDDEEESMVPPHQIIARKNPTFSVVEGIGRTLKGRDLSQVRNAVLRKTGFLD